MKTTRLFTESRAASSVIGPILLVATVVILGASVGTFALGLGEKVEESPPKVSFSAGQSEQVIEANWWASHEYPTMTIGHNGGDPVPKSEISVTVNGKQAWGVREVTGSCGTDPCHKAEPLWGGSGNIDSGAEVTVAVFDNKDSTISPGDTFQIGSGTDPVLVARGDPFDSSHDVSLDSGDTVRIVWEASGSGSTAVLFERQID